MAIFRVYPEGNDDAAMDASARTAREAAESYWEQRVLDGDARANEEERIIVMHADGPKVDPSATWYTDEDGTFARFDVTVMSVTVSAVEAK
jgi:hypothetical protein